jgi:ribonuclease HI
MSFAVLRNLLKTNYQIPYSYIDKLSSKNVMINDLSGNSKEDYFVFVDGGALRNGKTDASAGFSVHFEKHQIFNTTEKLINNHTNNHAELASILYSFNVINTNYKEFTNNNIIVVSDSMYSIKCITSWSKKWVKNDFKTSIGKNVANKEIIQEILKVKNEIREKRIEVLFHHIKSHTVAPGNKESTEYKIWFYNNLVDSNISSLLRK